MFYSRVVVLVDFVVYTTDLLHSNSTLTLLQRKPRSEVLRLKITSDTNVRLPFSLTLKKLG